MTTALKDLGIDRMSVAARVELALDIWESLEGEIPLPPLTAEDEAELDRRDREMEDQSESGLTWGEFRTRMKAGG